MGATKHDPPAGPTSTLSEEASWDTLKRFRFTRLLNEGGRKSVVHLQLADAEPDCHLIPVAAQTPSPSASPFSERTLERTTGSGRMSLPS